VIAPEQPGGNARRTGHQEQPLAGRPERGDPAEQHEAGHHDLRIPGILRSQAAELQFGRGMTGLAQRAGHPGQG